MKIKILGSGGWIPTVNRGTCAYLLKNKHDFLFLDIGSGVSNFELYPEIKDAQRITVVLSHYHLDHIIGIIYLLNICRDKELIIYGPGESFYGESCAVILERLIQPPYFSRRLKDFSHKVSIYDYAEEIVQVSPNFVIEFIRQNHSQPSFGMLVNDSLYYATDTSVVRHTFEKAKKVKLLLHECWDIEENSDKHSSLKSIIDMNKEYKLHEIKLIHLNPNWTSLDFRKADDLLQDSNISFANDGEEYEIED